MCVCRVATECCQIKGATEWQSDRSRQEFSNDCMIAKFRFDTTENEPSEICEFGGWRNSYSIRSLKWKARKAKDHVFRVLLHSSRGQDKYFFLS